MVTVCVAGGNGGAFPSAMKVR